MSRKTCLLSGIIAIALFLFSCTDNSVYNNTLTIEPKGWLSNDKAVYDVKLDQAGTYSIYLNLRHTDDYKYSNIFFRMYVKNPDGKNQTTRIIEVKLAEKDGKWIGSGSGKLVARKVFLTDGFKFAKPGTYRIELEQYMRDDPLKEISDIGIELIKK
ncbi:gliding motility lipoprotein GldH [Solitalea sp. MAHUQ-68]|uniref:Gliding motility lipoprotein GldH n=1 Tax=Solitalea agri TaxID=2953739 RepID=A0A9X2F2I2_9SPHI|nr:gliding motility lipoprotein GldH [Solitalea agri]MCO4292954.1 gliding motility lipoprotein GldH [Solitalea agri]